MDKLQAMLKYVSEHNDFYKKRIKEYGITNPLDINQWPILTRKELQENRFNMFSEGYRAKYYSQQLMRSASSGSSGIPINVYSDYQDYYSSVRNIWKKRLQYYGIHPSDKHVLFTLLCFDNVNNNDEIKYINDPKNILNINVSSVQNNNCEKIIDIINEFEPVWLYIRPYILQKLINIYKLFNKAFPASLKYIESYGEVLTIDLQKRASAFFRVPVVNMYGSEEMNTIAYECPYHNMHINVDNVLVECSNSDGIHSSGTGEAIITSLVNKAMPLIRYNQGDIIVLEKTATPCLCGSSDPTISSIKGRILDNIKINQNCELNSSILLEIMGEVNNLFDGIIICYRFVYNRRTKIIQCLIEINSLNISWKSNIIKAIQAQFERAIPCSDISLTVSVVKEIINTRSKHLIFEIED